MLVYICNMTEAHVYTKAKGYSAASIYFNCCSYTCFRSSSHKYKKNDGAHVHFLVTSCGVYFEMYIAHLIPMLHVDADVNTISNTISVGSGTNSIILLIGAVHNMQYYCSPLKFITIAEVSNDKL